MEDEEHYKFIFSKFLEKYRKQWASFKYVNLLYNHQRMVKFLKLLSYDCIMTSAKKLLKNNYNATLIKYKNHFPKKIYKKLVTYTLSEQKQLLIELVEKYKNYLDNYKYKIPQIREEILEFIDNFFNYIDSIIFKLKEYMFFKFQQLNILPQNTEQLINKFIFSPDNIPLIFTENSKLIPLVEQYILENTYQNIQPIPKKLIKKSPIHRRTQSFHNFSDFNFINMDNEDDD